MEDLPRDQAVPVAQRDSRRWWPWAAVLLLTLAGAYLRLKANGASLVGDELSTLWIVRGHGLGEALSRVSSDAEISPPLYFVLAWLATRMSENPDVIRLPALFAGIGAIPLTYLIGIRTIGKRAALIGTAVMAVSPAMVFFSADARSYSVAIFCLMASTLAMLVALDDGRKRFWFLFAIFTCLAMYSHYTVAFVLVGQLIWLLWRKPEARRGAIIASLGAAVFYIPWIPGFLADGSSITIPILEQIQGNGFAAKREAIEQILFFRIQLGGWHVADRLDFWLICIGLVGALLTLVGNLVFRKVKPLLEGARADGFLLVATISASTLVGELLLLAIGTDILGGRNLAASWAGLPLLIGALLSMNGLTAAVVFSTLTLLGFTVGSVRMADETKSGVGYEAAARLIDRTTTPDEPIVDASHLTPSPLTPLEIYLLDRYQYQPGVPEDSADFINTIYEKTDDQGEIDKAFAGPGPVVVLTLQNPEEPPTKQFFLKGSEVIRIPKGWKIKSQKTIEGYVDIIVTTFERKVSGSDYGSRDQTKEPDQTKDEGGGK